MGSVPQKSAVVRARRRPFNCVPSCMPTLRNSRASRTGGGRPGRMAYNSPDYSSFEIGTISKRIRSRNCMEATRSASVAPRWLESGNVARLFPRHGLAVQHPAYCASMTFSCQSTAVPFSSSATEICVMDVCGVNQTVSPGRASSIAEIRQPEERSMAIACRCGSSRRRKDQAVFARIGYSAPSRPAASIAETGAFPGIRRKGVYS